MTDYYDIPEAMRSLSGIESASFWYPETTETGDEAYGFRYDEDEISADEIVERLESFIDSAEYFPFHTKQHFPEDEDLDDLIVTVTFQLS